MPWFVIYTNPRAEKKVAHQLAALGITVYCPIVKQVRQWSDRKKMVEVPLFASYVFVNIEEQEREKVLLVKGVVRFLFWLGKPAVVRNEEITSIQKWLDTDYTDFEVREISKGDVLEIKDGPFKNYSGVVQEINKSSIRLIIESIGIMLTLKYNKLPALEH
jgi:transcriptional antiterminator RfaH